MELQVGFRSGDQQVLGVLHLPETTPAPAIIMCHGFTGHKAESHRLFVDAARDFTRHGLAVLRFDFRGSGDSEGEFHEMTVSREIDDARAALDCLTSRPEVEANRVGVLGLSLGGCVAACLAGTDQRVRALVLWAATAHPTRIADRLAPDFGGADVFDMEGWALGRAFLDDLPQIRPLAQVANYVGPGLVVHGSNDETVSPSDASDYRVALGGQCRLHMVEGADHVFSGLDYKTEAIEVSRDFLIAVLRPGA
ncbi:MAG TPA: alpha/beta fold hydrolase [Armatimonadota bacterium]|nr:alpha/beta fold hydrolase [Armatimonadota bacterium]